MQQPDSFRLVVRRGPQPNQTYAISKDITTLGRDITNDIVINDRETSRHHLRLQLSAGSVTLEDLGSTNGTFINGKRVSGVTVLQNGDLVGLGETVTLAFEIQRAQEAPAAGSALGGDLPTPAPILPPADPPPTEAAFSAPPGPYGNQSAADPFAPLPADAPPMPADAPPMPGAAYPEGPPQMQQPAYYGQPPAGYQIPAPPQQQYPGYDYDPYAAREEGGGSSQWLVLGCFVFFVLTFLCFGFVGLLLIDRLNLWCDTPVITQIVAAFGYCGI